MCWNFPVSISSWLIGLFTGLFLLRRRKENDIVFATLILTYSSMQLWEALMWLSQPKDGKCPKLNKIATTLAYFALWSHVLAIGAGLALQGTCFSWWTVAFGMGYLLVGIIKLPGFTCSQPVKDCNSKICHLVWGFDDSFYTYVFIGAMFLCIGFIRPVYKSIVACGIFLLSFFLSAWYAKKATGSFWCWVTAVYAPIFIFINA